MPRRRLFALILALAPIGCTEPPRGHLDPDPPTRGEVSNAAQNAGPVQKIPMH